MVMRSLFSNLSMVALFVCLSVKYASCLRCYECEMSLLKQSACDETYSLSSSMIKDCPDSDYVCLKVEFRIGDGYRRALRKCEPARTQDVGDRLEIKQTFMGISGTTYVCNIDLCNRTGSVLPSTTMILFISALLSIYFSCTKI